MMHSTSSSAASPFTRPRRPGYRAFSLVTLLGCAALIGYFVKTTAGVEVPASTLVGRWYGFSGALLFLFAALYSLRRQSYRQRFGSLELWYRVHLLFGAVAIAVLGCHSGFQLRSHFLGALQLGFWGTVLTGAGGWAWQTAFKRWLAENEWRPLVRSEVERERAAILQRLGTTSEGDATGKVAAIEQARRRLAQLRSSALARFPKSNFWDAGATRILAEPAFSALTEEDRRQLEELNRLEVQRSYHRAMRAWTTIHLIFTVIGVQLTAWHIWTVAVHPR
jgi:hypothetical protein